MSSNCSQELLGRQVATAALPVVSCGLPHPNSNDMGTIGSHVHALTLRWRRAVRSLWTLRDSRMMFCGTVLAGALCIWETIYSLRTPCLVSTEVFAADCAKPLRTLLIVQAFKVVIIIIASRLSERMFAVAIAQLGFQPCYRVASNNKVGGWAAASSEDVYTEIIEVRLHLLFRAHVMPP